MAEPNDPMPLQGEGDYIGARKYQKEQAEFARSGKVEEKAKEAEAALEGPEAEALEAARAAAAKGESLKKPS
jgi:hypothetical protein